jgi:serine/threonine protein kinase
MGATEAGVILGTAAYMAPEQARGQKVDKRADIWAFGVVLYEILTGERLFEGATASDVLAQVLTKEPDLDRVPAKTRRLDFIPSNLRAWQAAPLRTRASTRVA